jgi:DNA-binding cell septation regulator SpoVG
MDGPSKRVRVLNCRRHRSGALRGYIDVEFPYGLILEALPVFAGPRGKWVGMPTRPQIDSQGHAKTDVNGKVAYQPIGRWVEKRIADRFSNYLISRIEEQFPDLFEDVAA